MRTKKANSARRLHNGTASAMANRIRRAAQEFRASGEGKNPRDFTFRIVEEEVQELAEQNFRRRLTDDEYWEVEEELASYLYTDGLMKSMHRVLSKTRDKSTLKENGAGQGLQ